MGGNGQIGKGKVKGPSIYLQSLNKGISKHKLNRKWSSIIVNCKMCLKFLLQCFHKRPGKAHRSFKMH